MRYHPDEKHFWSFFRLMYGEKGIRTLHGLGNYGTNTVGKQNPDQCKINIAIPSLTERKKDSTDMSNFKTVPGFIDSCLDLLQTSGINEVNLAIDEE